MSARVKILWALFLIVLLAAMLMACEDRQPGDWESTIADQCLRAELFEKCMKMLPVGPQTTHYNAWDDVIKECGSQSYYQSLRRKALVKPECRP